MAQIQLEEDKELRCFSCKKTFRQKEAVFETVPDNFVVAMAVFQTSVPKCPHCGAMGFFGFQPK